MNNIMINHDNLHDQTIEIIKSEGKFKFADSKYEYIYIEENGNVTLYFSWNDVEREDHFRDYISKTYLELRLNQLIEKERIHTNDLRWMIKESKSLNISTALTIFFCIILLIMIYTSSKYIATGGLTLVAMSIILTRINIRKIAERLRKYEYH